MESKIVRHGEVLLVSSCLPQEAKMEETSKKYIVAHSETGHHHVLESLENFKVYSWNGDRYLEISEISELIHEKTGKDAHSPHKISPGIYKINIKIHFDYFAKKMQAVRD